ncbi:hypothetical protein QAD02_016677 [Eretmocerus hayati]|uniref:Uncharacterized protein n=1 Tax=Eretmocerus hayati TaxID=131215 RepID=A0ACC2PBA9_9HYME|nr:hypothetical protein QAD02_016677 [Eretmocerus hayati]
MIKSDMEVNENGVINVEDTEYEIFVELIRFIYTGQVHNIERMSEKLMIAADKYKVIQLKLKCEQYLIPLLTTVNVLKYLKLADQYDLNLLKKMAISFFVNNRKVIMKSANFSREIEVLRPGLTAELMLGFSSL